MTYSTTRHTGGRRVAATRRPETELDKFACGCSENPKTNQRVVKVLAPCLVSGLCFRVFGLFEVKGTLKEKGRKRLQRKQLQESNLVESVGDWYQHSDAKAGLTVVRQHLRPTCSGDRALRPEEKVN